MYETTTHYLQQTQLYCRHFLVSTDISARWGVPSFSLKGRTISLDQRPWSMACMKCLLGVPVRRCHPLTRVAVFSLQSQPFNKTPICIWITTWSILVFLWGWQCSRQNQILDCVLCMIRVIRLIRVSRRRTGRTLFIVQGAICKEFQLSNETGLSDCSSPRASCF
jgi:hypothetical protein